MKTNFTINQNGTIAIPEHSFGNLNIFNPVPIPHEWYSLSCLRREILENKYLADIITCYMFQFYPDYKLHAQPYFNPLSAIINEIDICDLQFQTEYNYGIQTDLVGAMLFGEIATDFLIRYHNYSLIKCSKCKVIITAQNNCNKKFEEYLYNGYSLQRRRKVVFKNKSNLEWNERFYKLQIFPTKEVGYPIDEIIEMEDGSYQKVL